MIDLDELEKLARSATAGPWWIDSHGHEMVNPESMELVFRTDNYMGELSRNEKTGNLSRWPNDNDATFIASFNPAVAMELITRLRQAEKDAARYRWLRDCSEGRHTDQLCVLFPTEWDLFVDEAMRRK